MNKVVINREIKRIKELFKKNNYNTKQKLLFLEAKIKIAEALNDENLLSAYKIIIKEINDNN